MDNCVFCKIVKGDIKAANVYEDKDVVAFLDISPAGKNGGHTLVLPKKHYEIITDIPDKELASLAKAVKKVSAALLKLSAGVNVLQNNKKAAGQYVMHAHFHIIPRHENDGITIEKWAPHEYAPGEIEEMQGKIKTLLNEY